MNSACAVVASNAIGSVPYLIQNRENGLVFKNRNWNDLYQKVKYLLDNVEQRKNIAKKAYQALCNTWNADVASRRLLQLIECIQNGKEPEFTDGPCRKD